MKERFFTNSNCIIFTIIYTAGVCVCLFISGERRRLEKLKEGRKEVLVSGLEVRINGGDVVKHALPRGTFQRHHVVDILK